MFGLIWVSLSILKISPLCSLKGTLQEADDRPTGHDRQSTGASRTLWQILKQEKASCFPSYNDKRLLMKTPTAGHLRTPRHPAPYNLRVMFFYGFSAEKSLQ